MALNAFRTELSGSASRRPVYIMIKPDAAALVAICRLRRQLGLDERYDASRLHSTLLPICDARDLTPELLARIGHAVAALSTGPFPVCFERVVGTVLRGGSAKDARRLQRELVRWLTVFGISLEPYTYDPHVSLSYGTSRPQVVPIQPIGWRVEELLLVESVYGERRHELRQRWPLIASQTELPF